MEFTVQMEKPSKVLRKLTVKVPAATVATRLEKRLIELQRTAKIKGFRPGNVPISVVKQYYDSDVRDKVFHDLIDESFWEAVRDQQLKTVGSPKIETPEHNHKEGVHGHLIRDGQDLTYIATVEILPEIEPKHYTGLHLERGKIDITDEGVAVVVRGLQDSRAELIPVTGDLVLADGTTSSRPVRKLDHVDINFAGAVIMDDGSKKEYESMKGTRVVEIGSGSLIPGFEESIIDMRRGDTKTFKTEFPKDYHAKDMAGKQAEFTVTVNEIKEKKLPTLDDEFAKQMGYEGLDDLRAKARAHLTSGRTDEVDKKLRSDLFQALIDKNQFDVPVALVESQMRNLANDIVENLKKEGLKEDVIKELITKDLDALRTRADKQVRTTLILEAIAQKEGISISVEEMDIEITKLAKLMRMEEKKLRDYYTSNPRQQSEFEFRLREERTVSFLLEKAKIKEV